MQLICRWKQEYRVPRRRGWRVLQGLVKELTAEMGLQELGLDWFAWARVVVVGVAILVTGVERGRFCHYARNVVRILESGNRAVGRSYKMVSAQTKDEDWCRDAAAGGCQMVEFRYGALHCTVWTRPRVDQQRVCEGFETGKTESGR